MSTDPSRALQQAVYTAIKTIAGGAVFHRVPDKQALPYVYIGDDDFAADYEAADLTDCSVEIHVFASTKPQLKLLAGEVRAALDTSLTIAGYRVYEYGFETAKFFRDPDGLTEHAVLEFRYLVGASE